MDPSDAWRDTLASRFPRFPDDLPDADELRGRGVRCLDLMEGEVVAESDFGVWLDIGQGRPALLLMPRMLAALEARGERTRPPKLGVRLDVLVVSIGPEGQLAVSQLPVRNAGHAAMTIGTIDTHLARELQRDCEKLEWTDIRNCPGRQLLAPGQNSESLDATLADQPGWTSDEARDEIRVVSFPGGGGVISYLKPDGRFVHTIGDTAGYLRKLAVLDVRPISGANDV